MKIINKIKNILGLINIYPMPKNEPYPLYNIYCKMYGKEFADSMIGTTGEERDAVFISMDFKNAIKEIQKELNLPDKLNFKSLFEIYQEATGALPNPHAMMRSKEYNHLKNYCLSKDRFYILKEIYETALKENPYKAFFILILLQELTGEILFIAQDERGKVQIIGEKYTENILKWLKNRGF